MTNITVESRREVARRLRDSAADGVDNPLRTLKYVLGLGLNKSYRDVFCALADLIDRPTCTPEVGLERQVCSECDVECIDGFACYCPNCGAEVVR